MTLYVNGTNGISADGVNWVLGTTSLGTYELKQKPSFDVASTAGVTASAVQSFNTVYFNNGGWFSTATGRFTAPVAGAYFFTCSSIKSAASATTTPRLYLRKNGVIQYNSRHYRMSEGSSYGDGSCSWLLELNINDYVEVWVGAAASHASTQYTWFNGFLLG